MKQHLETLLADLTSLKIDEGVETEIKIEFIGSCNGEELSNLRNNLRKIDSFIIEVTGVAF